MANYNHQNDSFFVREFTKFLSSTGNAALGVMFQKEMQKKALYDRQERERLKQEIINEIMSNFHATVDVSEIIQEIDELRYAIERLGK